MTKQKETGGTAFPFGYGYSGMTLRDYFAAKAMQGFISGSMADGSTFGENDDTIIASISYKIADAMLKARND